MGKKIKKKPSIPPTEKNIIKIMEERGRPLLLREIYHALHIPSEERKKVRELIQRLTSQGRLVHLKGKRYGLPEKMRLVTGRLTVHRDGYGFVETGEKGQPDVFIPPGKLKGAVDGDRVVVRIEKSGRRPEGSIIRILERGRRKIIGYFHRGRHVSTVIPEEENLFFEVFIPKGLGKGARSGQIVVAELIDFRPERRNPEGRVIEVLGDPKDLSVQTKIVIHKYDLPHELSEAAKKELQQIPDEVREEDKAGREDLTEIPLVTIDGETARDFDDAVYVAKRRQGWRLYVAIADVSHYVPQGSALDEEAYRRGTSVYFPNAVVPMFPEKLSNNLCSLNPEVERLALAVIIDFDRQGRVKRSRFTKAVIRSHHRFSYTEVKKILVDRDRDLRREHKPFLTSLKWMAELAMEIKAQREARGSIDFDLPEPQIILSFKGELEDIVRRERNLAHMIIEEFMIAANEAVARHLTEREYPILYRVHEAPDLERVKEFVEFAASLGLDLKVPRRLSPAWFQQVLKEIEGKPYAYIVNTILLRTMKQASYDPYNLGHFGLASECYCHFTSPIRRYPDLVVHRALKALLEGRKPPYRLEDLKKMGQHLSHRERVAMEAEREMIDRVRVRLLAERLGEEYEGVISGVAAFGFFVELFEVFVSGVVRLVDLSDDYYILDEKHHRLVGTRTGRVFQIGDVVRVRVKAVDIARRHINFELIESRKENGKKSGRRRKRRSKKKKANP